MIHDEFRHAYAKAVVYELLFAELECLNNQRKSLGSFDENQALFLACAGEFNAVMQEML